MKLLLIWLVGVPLAIGVMCATAALWPRDAGQHGHAQQPARASARASAEVSDLRSQSDLEHVLLTVRQ